MSGRYLAVVGSRLERQRIEVAAQRRAGFEIVFSSERMVVLTTAPDAAILLPNQAGVIIGQLFTKSLPASRVTQLDSDVGTAVVESVGDRLLSAYWGSYVALLDDRGRDAAYALREPSGGMPCYYSQGGALLAIASDVDIFVQCSLLAPSVDWNVLNRYLSNGAIRSERTCLDSLLELLPGFKLRASGTGAAATMWWSPWVHAMSPCIESEADLAEQLCATVRSCIHALARASSRILVPVSGGLDSSIVAACLADQGTPFECVTMATGSGDGDERQHARRLCDFLGVPLHEDFYALSDLDVQRSQGSGLPRPVGLFFDQSFQEKQKQLVRHHGFDAIFNGSGGDNVFCFTQSVSPLLDRLEAEGWRASAWDTLDDICQLTGASIWKVARVAIRRRLAARPPIRKKMISPMLMNADLGAEDAGHPWFNAPRGVLSGKRAHVEALARSQVALDSNLGQGWPPTLQPLLSQPIMEMCLTIPSWKWIAGGRNRSIARRAFAPTLPATLINRRTKGGPDSFSIESLENYRAGILSWLEDGLLARNGLIDRCRVRAALEPGQVIKPPTNIHLVRLIAAESWAREWSLGQGHLRAA